MENKELTENMTDKEKVDLLTNLKKEVRGSLMDETLKRQFDSALMIGLSELYCRKSYDAKQIKRDELFGNLNAAWKDFDKADLLKKMVFVNEEVQKQIQKVHKIILIAEGGRGDPMVSDDLIKEIHNLKDMMTPMKNEKEGDDVSKHNA